MPCVPVTIAASVTVLPLCTQWYNPLTASPALLLFQWSPNGVWANGDAAGKLAKQTASGSAKKEGDWARGPLAACLLPITYLSNEICARRRNDTGDLITLPVCLAPLSDAAQAVY